ncbi:MAG: cell surface protein SprA [Gemmatimonadaceae bacterium]|nr:cell surface protein SprA [Gemmatimonadaceae bacterium]
MHRLIGGVLRQLVPGLGAVLLAASSLGAQVAPRADSARSSASAPALPIAGLTLRTPGDGFVFRPLRRFGVLTSGQPYHADPRRVANAVVGAAEQRLRQRAQLRWVAAVQAPLLAREVAPVAADSVAPVVAAARPDSGPTPGALVPLRPDGLLGADAKTRLGEGDFLSNVGTLGITLRSSLESKMSRTRNERCTSAQLTVLGNNCNGSFQPLFDYQFNLRTGGVVANRVHLNVDYDSQREFDASNNISVYYEGKSDEMLQRLEVGNVSFQAPASRFLTSGIPSGNYGIQATGQIGPMRFTSIAAQQKGNVSKDNVFTMGERTQQQVERPIEDIQIETRRFFFTIDPRRLTGYPNIDLLNRPQMQQLAAALPDSLRPTRVYVYRQFIGAANQNPRGPQFSVRGARNPSRQVYEVLRENVDYYIDQSQLWIALVRPLNTNTERLAVAYEVNVGGAPGRNINTGGTPDIEFTDATQFANLLWEPELQPSNVEYFNREIKSIYRLGGEDLQRETVTLKLVTGISGDQEKPFDVSRGETYLQLFGLSQATNPTAFDVENRVWPRPSDPNYSAVSGGRDKLIRDYFIFFPSLQPFARAGLAQPQANPANDTLYRYPNEYLYSAQRPQAIYRMIARYQSEGGSAQYSLRLNSLQVRPNSERVLLEGRVLEKDKDYTIEYELGTISFTRGDTLFPRPRQVNVRYEENPLFASAPITILGFASQFPLDNGQLSFTAISQQQRSGYNRPPLGFEPIGSLVAGVTGNMAWDASLLNSLVKKLPFANSSTRSRLSVLGEFAMSKPQPNSAGQAYVESFEGDAGVNVSLTEGAWYYGSRPALGGALGGVIGAPTLNVARAATLAYQNSGLDGAGDFVQYRINQIDPSVRIVGGGVQPPETLLWMTLYPSRIGGIFDFEPGTDNRRFAWTIGNSSAVGTTPTGRRWRAVRTVLNPSGADLSRIENVEFFVQVQAESSKRRLNPTLVLDFGEISENSVTFAPETLTIKAPLRAGLAPDSTYRGKRLVGFDRLDSERDKFSRAFNAVENDKGLAGDVADTIVIVDQSKSPATTTTANGVPLCTQSVNIVQVLGDSRAICTVSNNRLDEEDIDLDGQLNLTSASTDNEQLRRFVVDLSDSSTWTRVGKCDAQIDSSGTVPVADTLCWVQVRLNWRAPLEELNNPNERRMRALRLTVVSSAQAPDDHFSRIALARFRLVGAPWLKRTDRPIIGAAGDSTALAGGYVIASVVGTLDSSSVLPYTPPPGVGETPENRQSGYENTITQVNERALRLQTGVPGQTFRTFDRAEAFYRFPEGTKSFMGYRTLRLWMRGRGNGWGQNGELNGFVKIGRDEHNFYMYRTPVNTGPAQSAWDPEIRVDLTRFQFLRAQLENNFLKSSPDSLVCTGTDLELIRRSGLPRGLTVRRYAVCQDGYIVYSADPSVTPPNLAGVQELSVGLVRVDSIARGGQGIMANDTLELWVNDIRLTDVVDDIGFAGELGVSMNAGDLADFRVNVSRRDPNFRQLGENPSFLTTSGVSFGTTLHLERLLPARLGIVMPVNIDYAGSGVDQLFINRSDVRAAGIDGLRNPKDRRMSYSMALRRAVPLNQGWYAPVLNGLTVTGSWSTGATKTAFQESSNANYALGASLDISDDRRESRLPGVVDKLFGALPRFMRESGAIKSMRSQTYRWSPSQFRISSTMARNANSTTSFTKAAVALSDTGQIITGLSHAWINSARLEFRPTLGITGSMDARQVLDLRDYRDAIFAADSTDRRQAAANERLRFLGADVGLEQDRTLISGVLLQPQFSLWFQPRLDLRSTFRLSKDANARALLREGDSVGAFRLPKRLGAAQSISAGTQVQFGRLIMSRTNEKSWLHRVGKSFTPTEITWQRDLTSNYDNTIYNPDFGYQLGLGGISAFRGLSTNQLATGAGRVQNFSTISAVNLPLSLNVQARLEQGTTETWTRRALDGFQALITSERKTYPDISVRWNLRPVRLRKVVSNLSLNGRTFYSEQNSEVPNETGGLADRSSTQTNSYTVSGAVTWAFLGNLTTNGSYYFQHREDSRPGSLQSGDTKRVSFDVTRNVPLPKKWNTRTGQLRTRFSYQSEESLAEVGGTTGNEQPTPASLLNSVLTNNGRQAFNVNADTEVSELLAFSLTASHVLNFDRNFNRRLSTTVVSVVLRMSFFAGELR